jgi:hypothetical protein
MIRINEEYNPKPVEIVKKLLLKSVLEVCRHKCLCYYASQIADKIPDDLSRFGGYGEVNKKNVYNLLKEYVSNKIIFGHQISDKEGRKIAYAYCVNDLQREKLRKILEGK